MIASIVAVLAVAACGSSSTTGGASGSAQSLIKQTFSSSRSAKSGVLGFALTVKPTGSSTLSTPITLSVSGPFQSRGSGKLPQSDLTLAISALGKRGSLGVISTGSAGYVNLEGVNYQLPQADFQKLESSFSSTSGSGSGEAGLAQLGINPMHWLTNPSIVGTETVGGASTTHIRAGVNVTALISDLNTFLAKAAKKSTTGGIPSQIPAATAQKIASVVKNATVDVWTGKSDTTLRKLALSLSVPVTGQISTELGGMTAAGLGLTVQYSDLNQAQSIATPTNVHPYSEFATKLQSIGQALTGALGGSALGGTTTSSSGSGAPAPGGSGSAAGVSKYSQCIQKAGGDVSKMQKCASLLNGG
ncbi:MAG: hypothetical protein ACR2NR_10350 [Solirubrobacteraceae bacterium]